MKRNQTQSRRPSHAVYLVEGEGESAYWTKIGAAWGHEDGDGFNISLSAIPLTGRLVMVVAGRLEGAGHRLPEAREERDEAVVLGAGIEHGEATASLPGHLDEHLVADLGHVDGYENASDGRKLVSGHGRSVSRVGLATPSL